MCNKTQAPEASDKSIFRMDALPNLLETLACLFNCENENRR